MPTLLHARTNLPPLSWPDPVKRAIVNNDTTAAGMEILRMDAGFRALPVDPETKAPFPFVTPHGVKDATGDPVVLQQWFAISGDDAGLGLVPGHGFALFDDDAGDLDIAAYGLAGTFGERTRRGFHYWAQIPTGRHLRKSRLKDATGDLITGDRAYAVMSPTPPYFPLDIDAPILSLPDDSPVWGHVLTKPAAPRLRIAEATEGDLASAQRVVRDLVAGPYGQNVRLLLAGEWSRVMTDEGMPRYASQSEGDLGLMAMSVYGSAGNPAVLDAVMRASELFRAKWDAVHFSDGATYGEHTISLAISTHATSLHGSPHNPSLVSSFLAGFGAGLVPATGAQSLQLCLYGTFALGIGESGIRQSLILGFVERFGTDEKDAGFVRVPVSDFAASLGVDRKTIRRDLETLKKDGLIETFWLGSPSRHVRERYVRLVDSRSERSAA